MHRLRWVQVSSAVPRDSAASPQGWGSLGWGAQHGEGSRSCGDHRGARGGLLGMMAPPPVDQDVSRNNILSRISPKLGMNKLRLGVAASVWGPSAPEPHSGQGGLEGDPAEGPSECRRQRADPKVTLQSSPSETPQPVRGAGGAPVPADTGHQAGEGTGAPFPASTAAAPASFASDLPNYS